VLLYYKYNTRLNSVCTVLVKRYSKFLRASLVKHYCLPVTKVALLH